MEEHSQQTTSRQKEPTFVGEVKFTWRGRETTLRLTSAEALSRLPADLAAQTLYHQMSDLTEVTLLAMTALAQDVYSRAPDGSREFEDLIKALGLKFSPRAVDELTTPVS